MKTFDTINPATEKVLETYSFYSDSVLKDRVDLAHKSWLDWKETSFSERSKLLQNLQNLLNQEKDRLAREITEEMGKPLAQSVAEVEKCMSVCEYYANHAEDFLQPDVIASEASKSYVRYDPLGIVLAVMPWNFPYWQLFRFAAPALMAGNGCLLKHSPNTTGCALSLQSLFEKAGFPKYLLNTILADIPQIEAIVANPKIKAVTLTGSTGAGKSLASLAGKYLKKSVLELGGSDPYIILPDADLVLTAEACVTGRLINNGQSCIAAKRFIVHASIEKPFKEKIIEQMQKKRLGDPFEDNTDLGPLARKDLRDSLHTQVLKSVDKGAKILLGGKMPDSPGYYYSPTILENVVKGMPAYDEELFGPVASVITVKNEEEALQVANDTIFGLGSAIFSQDLQKAERMASRIEAGSTFINTFVKSDPRLPFGGIKESGFGRELSFIGIKEFVNAKTIYIR